MVDWIRKGIKGKGKRSRKDFRPLLVADRDVGQDKSAARLPGRRNGEGLVFRLLKETGYFSFEMCFCATPA